MNLKDISTQLLFTTAPLWAEIAGKTSSATAFFYNAPVPGTTDQSIPLLVTNRHAIAGANRVVVEFIERKGDQPDTEHRLLVDIDPALLLRFSDASLDLAVAPIGGLLNEREVAGKPLFFRSIDPSLVPSEKAISELSALEEIVFIGYPSGLRDAKNSNPLIRRGITATPVWNHFQGHPAFLIDAGVFPGSSGSPVFILNQGAYATGDGLTVGNRILFLGVVYETMVRSAGSEVFLGLGKVVRSDVTIDFLNSVAKQLVTPPPEAVLG